MTAIDPSEPGDDRRHYSYAHYADRDVAEGFDALRFSGPIGRYLLESQEALLLDALTPPRGRTVLDVGTGTGRAAIGLARAGARVTGLDASREMLRVASVRARDAGVVIPFGVADAHALPFADRSVDAAVSLRVLMHAIDWKTCLAELCRVARWRVVVDFPALGSFAALESGARRAGNAGWRPLRSVSRHGRTRGPSGLRHQRLSRGDGSAPVRPADCVAQAHRPARIHRRR